MTCKDRDHYLCPGMPICEGGIVIPNRKPNKEVEPLPFKHVKQITQEMRQPIDFVQAKLKILLRRRMDGQ